MKMQTFARAFIYYTLLFNFTFVYSMTISLVIMFDYLKSIVLRKKFHLQLKTRLIRTYADACLCTYQLSGLKIYLKGDKITKERTLWICNHRTVLDAIIIQTIVAYHKNWTSPISKTFNKVIPFFNVAMMANKTIFVRQGKEKDIDSLEKGAISSEKDGYSISLFPEGFIMSKTRLDNCHKFCLENGIKQTYNVLTPRRTGFDVLQRSGNFTNIGNLTIRYENPPINTPNLHDYLDLFSHFPREVYVENHYEKITGDDLCDVFLRKDESLNNPVVKSEYRLLPVSKWKIIYNLGFLILFYYAIYKSSYFAFACLCFTILSPLLYFF